MIRTVAILSTSLLVAMVSSGACAADMTFFMKNHAGQPVAIELYGHGDHVWPGNDKVYLLETDEQKSVPIQCEAGERVCYGAWLVGNDAVRWGAGPDNDQGCKDCCTICVGKALAEIDLTQ